MFTRLELPINWFTYTLLHLDTTSHRTQVLNFFIYDSIKILILLIVIIYIMTLINSYLPIEKIRTFLAKRNRYWLDYFFASIFGTITPFCSCSSVPIFIGFLKAWIPLGVIFSFLISSPLVDSVAIALLLGMFGLKITAIYVISWIVLWILWWRILWKMKLEKYLADFIQQKRNNIDKSYQEDITIAFKERIHQVSKDARILAKKIIPYILLWVSVGAAIHGFVPTGFFENYITKDNLFAVPIAVLIWIPMYADSTWVMPVVQALIAKWIPLWTWLAFMMAVVALSLPAFLILKKVMKSKLLFLFFWITGLCIILLGYFFNLIF